MDIPVRIDAEVDSFGLIEALVSSPVDLIEFITELDREISDESFTLRLIEKLCKSLCEEYTSTLHLYTERMLQNTFGEEGQKTPISWYSFPDRKDIAEMETRSEKMEEILKLLSRISNGI